MDTLQRIKNRLNIDQRNLVSAEVISTATATAKVRLTDGSERTTYLPDGLDVSAGDLVSVAISGNLATVQGVATLQPPGGRKVKWIGPLGDQITFDSTTDFTFDSTISPTFDSD